MIGIMIETVGLAETIVDQATDRTMDQEIIMDRETLMGQDQTMVPAITTDQDQTIDHRKEATLVHHNPNLTLHKK
jgi:hypothetical protein